MRQAVTDTGYRSYLRHWACGRAAGSRPVAGSRRRAKTKG